jgi:hypothetical protein
MQQCGKGESKASRRAEKLFPVSHQGAQIPAHLLSKYHQLGGKRELASARSSDIHTFFSETRFKVAKQDA